MELALPTYKISKNSSTEDLRILEKLYSEIGGFASTILDSRHFAFSKECVKRLRKITSILEYRNEAIAYKAVEETTIDIMADLSKFSVDELYNLYVSWPERHKKRTLDGREKMTFYYEGRIIRELKHRKALTDSERLKVDYCKITYQYELENMSLIYSIPVGEQKELQTSCGRYTSFEVESRLNRYSNFRTIAERELLVELVDMVLDRMQSTGDKAGMIGLATQIVELGRRDIVKVPAWTVEFLSEAIAQGRKDSRVSEAELVLPLLTLNIQTGSPNLEREAQRIINRCYKSALNRDEVVAKRIENLHTAVICCDYVTRFSIRKAATVWNEITTQALSDYISLTPMQAFQLLEIAKKCDNYAKISSELKDRLQEILSNMAQC